MELDDMRNGAGGNSRPSQKLVHAGLPRWRSYLNSYLEKEKRLELDDKFDERVPAVLHKFPEMISTEELHPPYYYFPSNTFNLREQMSLPHQFNRTEKIRIWRNMKANPEIDMSSLRQEIIHEVKRTDSGKWPEKWPCIGYDVAGALRQIDILKTRKLRNLLSCQEDPVDDSETGTPYGNSAFRKELGHARIPKLCVDLKKLSMVERSCGDHPGLVDGDYITCEYTSENEDEKRVYSGVCLRGMKGMHLIELDSTRSRRKTWKFCFYQALVALLAKTQLRYKYASSINIDYIYDHAWMLFTHMGSINIKERHHFDDVVVYNYKYNVELELIQEMRDIPRITTVKWKYRGNKLKTLRQLKRPELMRVTEKLDWQKIKDSDEAPVHENTEKIEKWFDELLDNYRDCIFRTCRFSLAFWNDGNFWYLYNPYRCDRYGFWDDNGFACIMKFCTRITLKKHLMVLLLNAYVYKPPNSFENGDIEKRNDLITIQIFRVIYHCVKIHNIELLQRKPTKPRLQKKWRQIDDCNYDPVTLGNISMNGHYNIIDETSMEKPSWLKDFQITWTQTPTLKKSNMKKGSDVMTKFRWHHYYIERDGKLFSLWGEIHPTAEIFERENRGKQTYACYVVCAGMIRIMAPEYWSDKILDAIVMCGDRYYTLSRLQSGQTETKNVMENSRACSRYLSRHFNIGEILFEVDVLSPICGKLYTRVSLWKVLEKLFLTNTFAILTCENASLGLFKFCGTYYMLDVNSIGPPIFNMGGGAAYLMRATSFREFMLTLILTIGSIECSSFVLDPIDIVNIIDLGTLKSQPSIERNKTVEDSHAPYEKNRKKKSKKGTTRNKRTGRTTCKSSPLMG